MKWIALAAFSLVMIAPLHAQNAEISGFIRDPSGAAIPHAAIVLQDITTSVQYTTTSNESGVYVLAQLRPGLYRLSVSATGFERRIIDGITLDAGSKITHNADLNVGSVSEAVTVSGVGVNVNTVDASVSTVVDRRFVENIPLNGRSFNSLLTLIPGATVVPSAGTGQSGSITVNGQRTESNYFTVDGVSANSGVALQGVVGFGAGFSGSTPGETALGTTQGMVSVDALQEFRATTSTFSAEYGRTPGGQFSFTTRSGTNEWHGGVFNYFRNDALDANNWFSNVTATQKPATRQNNFGGTLGGPVLIPKLYDGRNRTFFFFSYEGLRLRSPQAGVLADVPSLSMRSQAPASLRPILNSFPAPTGPDYGNGLAPFISGYSNPSSIDTTAIRIDHSFSDGFRVFGRYSDAPSSSLTRYSGGAQTSGNLAQTIGQTVHIKTITLGATSVITPRITNDTRFNTTWNDGLLTYKFTNFGGATPMNITDYQGYTDDPYTRLAFTLNWGLRPSVYVLPQDATQKQHNFTNTLHWSIGRHLVKFGIDYRRIENRAYFPKLYNIPNFNTAEQVLANTTATHTYVGYTNAIMRPVYRNFSAFVQDDVRVTPRLSISTGVRWEVNPAPTDAKNYPIYTIDQAYDLSTTKLAPLGTPTWKTTYNNFAPRLGIAYQARQTQGSETVIRSGFGVFYDTGNTQATDGYGRIGSRGQVALNGTPWPLTPAQIAALPALSIDPPYQQSLLTDDPNLKLPYTLNWSAAVEQNLGSHQTLTVSYIGSGGRRLLVDRVYMPRLLGNLNFGTPGLYLTKNLGFSSYNALQAQFTRRLTSGLQVLASYTWSHAIDNATSNFTVYQLLRASSDYDVRHNFQAAITYLVPGRYQNHIAAAVLSGWAVDSRVFARSALPLDVIGATSFDPATALQLNFHPNLVSGQPLYLNDSNAPGGRKLNFAAFSVAPAGTEGNSGRNIARGFKAIQTDLALRREFRVSERVGLQFRVEGFNIFNHPIFGAVYSNLTNGPALFGVASNTLNSRLGGLNPLYQVGGPRSVQLALKASF